MTIEQTPNDSAEATEMDSAAGLILFDGVCNLCNAAVQRVIAHDPHGQFQFGSLQSEVSQRVLENALSTAEIEGLPDSIVLVDAKGVHTRSTAAMRIARGVGFPYAMLGLGVVLPRPVRDALYGFVARNRYRWFGRQDRCMVPTPELASRFIDSDGSEPRVG
jgi:predicted DCC family thiol-disulfide oxidoreductase YuxK